MEGITKIKDLTPDSKRVNVFAKVVSKTEPKEVQTRMGESRRLTEAVVGDETATVIMTLWGDQSDTINVEEHIYIDNGYISLVRGHMRLNTGKYGKVTKPEDEKIEEVNTSVDMSAQEFDSRQFRPEKRFYGNREGRDSNRGRDSGRRDFRSKRF